MKRIQGGQNQNGKDQSAPTNEKLRDLEGEEFVAAPAQGGDKATEPLLWESRDVEQISHEFPSAMHKTTLSKLEYALEPKRSSLLPSLSFDHLRFLTPYVVPVFAVGMWWIFNVAIIIGNKIIFQRYGFRFPLSLSTIHFFISTAGAYFSLKVLQVGPLVEMPGKDWIYRMGPMSIATCINIVLGNMALNYIPVTFMQTIKAFTPVTTVLLQRIVWGKSYDYRVYLALLPVSGGICVASASELSFHLVGFLCAFASCFVGAFTTIMAEVLLTDKYKLDSLNAVYYMMPQATILLLPFALFFEFRAMYVWFLMSDDRYIAIFAIVASGLAAFFLNFALFMAVKATSAISFTVAGNLKVTCAIIIGWLVFQNPMSAYSSLGCALTLGGCTVYGYIQHMVRAEKQALKEQQLVTVSHKLVAVDEEMKHGRTSSKGDARREQVQVVAV